MDYREAGIAEELILFRERIDKIDEQLIALIAARYSLVYATLSLKKSNDISPLDRSREDEITKRLELLATGKLPTGVAKKLIQEIINVLRDQALYELGWYARN